jgi:hypothetical protein
MIEMLGIALGVVIVAAVILNLAKGLAPSNGETPRFDDAWNAPDSGDP